MGLSLEDFYDLTLYEANLLADQYKEDQEAKLNQLAYAVFYGVGSALSKKGFKPIKSSKTKPKTTTESLDDLIKEYGG